MKILLAITAAILLPSAAQALTPAEEIAQLKSQLKQSKQEVAAYQVAQKEINDTFQKMFGQNTTIGEIAGHIEKLQLASHLNERKYQDELTHRKRFEEEYKKLKTFLENHHKEVAKSFKVERIDLETVPGEINRLLSEAKKSHRQMGEMATTIQQLKTKVEELKK